MSIYAIRDKVEAIGSEILAKLREEGLEFENARWEMSVQATTLFTELVDVVGVDRFKTPVLIIAVHPSTPEHISVEVDISRCKPEMVAHETKLFVKSLSALAELTERVNRKLGIR